MRTGLAIAALMVAAILGATPALAQFQRPEVTAPATATLDIPEVWRTDGFKAPESVAYEPASKTLLVSNIAVTFAAPPAGGAPGGAPPGGGAPGGAPPTGGVPPGGAAPGGAPPGGAPGAGGAPTVVEEPTDGYISQVGLDGTVIKERFVDGLDRPSGLTVSGDTLWVLAGDVYEIDLATQQTRNIYARPEGIGRLTDVRVADDGRVFVTDMYDATIFVIENGQLTEWLKDEAQLNRVNGLVIDGGTLYVNVSGKIKQIDIATKAISPYGTDDVTGAGDDLIAVPGGLLAAAFGNTILVDAAGTVTQVLPAGVNGLEYVPDEKLIVVTQLRDNQIAAYQAPF